MRMDKYGRELDLLLMLTDNGSHTAQQLADRLGITRRNLYYYFDYLRASGFQLIKTGTYYRLDRSSPFFRHLHENIALSEDEAAFICRMLSVNAPNDYMAQAIRQKLSRSFHLPDAANPELQRRVSECLAKLREAMARQQMVVLHNYSSPHSRTVSDRIVEPFLLMNDGRDVRCYELRSHQNKTFKLSRIESVEIIDVPWTFQRRHKQIYTDMFMFSGEELFHVELRLGQLSHNLMLEEYPQSEQHITTDDEGHWIFSADVASFLGIGRFVIGLYDDIGVLGSDAFCKYISDKVMNMNARHSGDATTTQ